MLFCSVCGPTSSSGFIQLILFTLGGAYLDSGAPSGSVQCDLFPDIRVYITVFFKLALRLFLKPLSWPLMLLSPVMSSLKRRRLGRRLSPMCTACPTRSNWCLARRVWMLCMSADFRTRTSVSCILSCHLILSILLMHFRWSLFNFLVVSRVSHEYRSEGRTTTL